MKRVAIAIICVLSIGCSSSNKSAYDQNLIELSGKGASNCGSYELAQDPTPGFKCAAKNLNRNIPFLLSIQQPSNKSEFWRGFVQSVNNTGYIVEFQSSSSGFMPKSKLTVKPCHLWQVSVAENSELSCYEP